MSSVRRCQRYPQTERSRRYQRTRTRIRKKAAVHITHPQGMSKQGYGRVTMHVTHHQSTGLSAVRQVTPPIQHQSESSQPLSTLQRCDAVLIMDATNLHDSECSGKNEYVSYAIER